MVNGNDVILLCLGLNRDCLALLNLLLLAHPRLLLLDSLYLLAIWRRNGFVLGVHAFQE